MQRLNSYSDLERIVLDEVYFVLLNNYTYRPHLGKLRRVVRFSVRLTLLLATILVKQKVEFFQLLSLLTDTVLFRTPTNRTNLAWQVRRLALTEGEETEFLASYIRTEAT